MPIEMAASPCLPPQWCGVDSLNALVEYVCMCVTRWHFLLDWRFHQAAQSFQLDVLFWHKYLLIENLVQMHCSSNCILFLFLLFFSLVHVGTFRRNIKSDFSSTKCHHMPYFFSWLSLSSFSVQILSGKYILHIYNQWQYYDIINTHPLMTTDDNNKESA